MNEFLRKDEIFEYEGEFYDYSTLKTLRDKSKGGMFKEGEVTSAETGNINPISFIENFYSEAVTIDINKRLIESSTISNTEIREINRRVITKEHKDFFDDVLSKMENDTATYEEVMKYWELKQLFKETDYKYEFNNFVKLNNNKQSIDILQNFSFINRGRIIELIRLITGKNFINNNVFISREDLMSLLQFESKEALKHFLASTEKQEIVFRKNKRNRNNLEFIINPFLFNRVQKIHLSAELYEMFPVSFKSFLDTDVYYYFKTISENEKLKFETEDL